MTEPILSEILDAQMGLGDHCTICFTYGLHGPVHPGSVVVREVRPDAIDRLALLADPTACVCSGHDILGDGILYGNLGTGTIDYGTSCVQVTFNTPPAQGNKIQVLWRRELHRLHDAKIAVKKSDGTTEEITMLELAKAVHSA